MIKNSISIIVITILIVAVVLFAGYSNDVDYITEIDNLINEKKFDEALNLIERFSEEDDQFVEVHLKLAQIEMETNKDPMDTLDKVLSIDPENISAYKLKESYFKENGNKVEYYNFLLSAYDITKDSYFSKKIDALKPIAPKLNQPSGNYRAKVNLLVDNFNSHDEIYYAINDGDIRQLRKDSLSFIKDTRIALYSENDLGLKSTTIIYEYTIDTFQKYLEKGLTAYEDGDLVTAIEALENALSFSEDSEKVLTSLIDIYTDIGETGNLIRILELASFHLNDEKYSATLDTLLPQQPQFSLEDGFYKGTQTLSLLKADSEVYFTRDGSDPSILSPQWSKDMTLDSGIHNIKAAAINDDGFSSAIVDYYYEVDVEERRLYFAHVMPDGSRKVYRKKLFDNFNDSDFLFQLDQYTQLTYMALVKDLENVYFAANIYTEDMVFSHSNIYVYSLKEKEYQLFYENAENHLIDEIATLDDRTLIFSSGTYKTDDGSHSMKAIDLLTKEITTFDNAGTNDAYVSSSGDKVFFSHRSVPNWSYSSDIWMMDNDGGNKTNLINDTNPESAAFIDYRPHANGDLSKVAFGSFRFSGVEDYYKSQIAVLDMRNGNISELMDIRTNFFIVDWFDNDTLLVRTYNKNKETQLLMVEMDGSYQVLESSKGEDYHFRPLVYK